jgi:hypothetical protein
VPPLYRQHECQQREPNDIGAAASIGLLTAGVVPKRGDEALTGGLACYSTYLTKDDRHVSLGALDMCNWGPLATPA